MMKRSISVAGLALASAIVAAAAAIPSFSRAESWCADPLWVHEWGVQVFGAGGARRVGPVGPHLPRYFHNQPSGPVANGPPVRGMPIDGGERELPVLHFYTAGGWSPVPLGLEVGFTRGDATVWYPQVDARRAASGPNGANGPAAAAGRTQLLAARRARTAAGPFGGGVPPLLPTDPTRQLEWDNLTLTTAPLHTRATSDVAWVDRLRGFDDALWVNSRSESERFVFYEARTSETAAIRLERGPTYAPGRRHLLLHNLGRNPVYDVFLVHREGADVFVFYAPSIPAGRSAGVLLEDHRTTPAQLAAATRGQLRRALVDTHEPRAPTGYQWDMDHCVMQRDPAQAVETAEGHRLYAAEVDAILDAWGPRFFDAPGTTLLYREDPHYLDTVMPLSPYSDMYHYIRLRRAGLALIEGAQLP